MSIAAVISEIFDHARPPAPEKPVGPGGKDQLDFSSATGILEALEERQAIMQHDGGMSVAESASHAWRDVCCRSCKNRSTPGLTFPGYCAVRSDQPPAYGAGHPLHRLPPDFGSTCTRWAPHD